MKNPLYRLNFTSGTTSALEALGAIMRLGSQKDYIGEYHHVLSQHFGGAAVFSFAAARMALFAILKAAGIGQGDEVILQGYTCVVVPKAIMFTGAMPVYVDIKESDYNIDFDDMVSKITDKTRAIVVQYTYGNPCKDIFKVKDVCRSKNILLIEDCAHILGSSFEGHMLGTIGDAAIISTDHTKYISTSVGGAAIINDSRLAENLKQHYQQYQDLKGSTAAKIAVQLLMINILFNKNIFKIGVKIAGYYMSLRLGLTFFMSDYDCDKMPEHYPFPAKLPNVLAYVGLRQMRELEANIEHRKKITKIYQEALLGLISESEICEAPLRFPLAVEERQKYMDALSKILRAEAWFDCLLQGAKEDSLHRFFYRKGMCPKAEKVSKLILNLPTHTKVSEKDAKEIARIMLEVKH